MWMKDSEGRRREKRREEKRRTGEVRLKSRRPRLRTCSAVAYFRLASISRDDAIAWTIRTRSVSQSCLSQA